jgi:glycosyltransferase involved in cell wall biosynthesis
MFAPLVSVIVPCFNAGPMLASALKSIIGQTYPAIEIIFIDNNSTDGSAAFAEEALAAQPRPFRIARCEMQGANAARNFGYRFASGDYVNWMDADDLIDSDKIARQVAALEAPAAYDIAFGDYTSRWLPPAYTPREQKRTLAPVKDQIRRVLSGVWYPPHLYLIRRAAADRLQEANGWMQGRMVATDVEYSAIAALMGLKFLYVPGAHVTYNIWSKSQISGRTRFDERVRTLEAIYGRLRTFVDAAPTKVTLTARHKMLLNQEWTMWALPNRTVSITRSESRGARLRHVPSGRELVLRPWESAIAQAMIGSGQALPSSVWGVFLTEVTPPVADDPTDVVEVVTKLRREGFLVRADPGPGGAPALAEASSNA